MEARLEDVFRSGGRALRESYPALVTAAASFLLVALLWPQSPRTYLAEAMAAANSRDGGLVPADEALSWLQSEEVLRTVIANLRAGQPQCLAAIQGNSAATDPMDALRGHLHLAALGSVDEMPRLAIGYDAPRRQAALAVVDELGQQLAERYAAQRRHERLARFHDDERRANQELKDARAAEERLEVELRGLQHAHLTSALAARGPQVHPALPASAGPSADPRRAELSRSLEALKIERQRLLEIYLPAHPQIQTLSAQISRLEESLLGNAPDPEEAGAGGPAARDASRSGARVILQWRRSPDSAEVLASGQEPVHAGDELGSELIAAIGKAQLELLAATHQRQQAERKHQIVADSRTQIESESDIDWTVQPARIADIGGGSPARQQLAAALVAASLGGVAVAWLARRAARDRPLTTAAELRSTIALPVLAMLSGSDDEMNPAATVARSQVAVQFVTRCAEVVLLTFALTLLAAIALDRGLLAELTHDPLSTLGQLLERLF